jgi:hypothetical protein
MDTAGKLAYGYAELYGKRNKHEDIDIDGELHADTNADVHGDADIDAIRGDADGDGDDDGVRVRDICGKCDARVLRAI